MPPLARFVWILLVVVLGLDFRAEAATPKRILLIHSFGREFAPFDTIAAVFRAELARGSTDPIVFLEATLDAGRNVGEEEERAFAAYLGARFAGIPPDLVVTIGAAAMRFYLARRDSLFPAVPMIIAALDERLARDAPLRANDAAAVGRVDLPRLIDNILQLLPDTRTIAVVGGASSLERFWLSELRREAAPYSSRIDFLWLNDLSLGLMRDRVARLPPRSAVFYGLFVVDAAGVPQERQDALASLRAVANAPIFGIYEDEIGQGVVGGPYTSQRRNGETIAAAARQILSGATRVEPQITVAEFEPPVYDARELRRWGIDRARLPSGSEIRFQSPSIWDEHRTAIVAASAALLLQSALIATLLAQRRRRRAAEGEARSLGGRLISAHEDERRRLSRELHDDVTQRLAALAIEAARIPDRVGGSSDGAAARAVREGLVGLSEDVHALSYRLHPTVIEDLGLVEALRAECDRVARAEPVRVHLECPDASVKPPPDVALCVFRVAQEALRNVVRHAGASEVRVALRTEGDRLALAVRDDGGGFDLSRVGDRASLGLASMRERVRLLGGELDIESALGRGTAVVARVPNGGTA